MNTWLFVSTLLLLQSICWWIGKRSSQSCVTESDYFLGGKQVSFFPLMMTFLGGQVGGGLVLGSAQEAARIGWWVLLYPLGQVLGMLWLSFSIGKRLSRFQVSTIAQIFEKYYGSSLLKQIASLLSIASLFLILVAQILATKSFLISAGINNNSLFLLFWGIVLTYTGMGGFKAVIKTDLIQASFFMLMFGFAFTYAFFFSSAPNPTPSQIQETSISLSNLSGWLFMPLLFASLEQDMGQRCFAAKSEKILKQSAFTAACLTFLICLVPIYFGKSASNLANENGASILLTSIQTMTSPAITALIGAAIMAAILATADSLLNAITSNLSQDFSFLKKKSLNVTRIASFSIGALALLFSFYFDHIVSLLIQAYELSVCTLVVPLLGALFKKKQASASSAMLAIGCGAIGFFSLRYLPFEFPKEIGALALSLCGYIIGEKLKKTPAVKPI